MTYVPNAYNMYQSPVNGLTKVTGIDGARAYMLPPNSSMPLFDSDDDIMYVKFTDGAGFPTIKTYRFQLVEPEAEDTGDFVTKEELKEEFDKLLAMISAMVPENKEDGDGE